MARLEVYSEYVAKPRTLVLHKENQIKATYICIRLLREKSGSTCRNFTNEVSQIMWTKLHYQRYETEVPKQRGSGPLIQNSLSTVTTPLPAS